MRIKRKIIQLDILAFYYLQILITLRMLPYKKSPDWS